MFTILYEPLKNTETNAFEPRPKHLFRGFETDYFYLI